MEPIPFIAAPALALALSAADWQWKSPRRLSTKPGSLLTQAEMWFFRFHAVPNGLAVFAKARLMDVLFVADGVRKAFRTPASGMHVHFVPADAGPLGPVLVIQLDDRSHSGDAARKRDPIKDAALAAAGV